jgi:hypothetical protein
MLLLLALSLGTAGHSAEGGNAVDVRRQIRKASVVAVHGQVRYRSITRTDVDQIVAVIVTEPVGWHSAELYRRDLAARRCRLEWSWLAEADNQVVGRALWWGLPNSAYPLALECLYVDESVADRVGVAVELLESGLAAVMDEKPDGVPSYTLVLAEGWRADPAASAAVSWRQQAARRIGLTDELERSRFEWNPAAGLPPRSTRLTFSAEPDDDVVVEVLQEIAAGSLDVETRREMEALGLERTARGQLAFYTSMPGDRSWWRLARTANGQLAGLAIPSRNAYGPNVGYLGVIPGLRGHGYVHDLLAEITHLHAENGAQAMTGTTDTTNAPMAAAFASAGYRNTEIRLQLSAPPA